MLRVPPQDFPHRFPFYFAVIQATGEVTREVSKAPQGPKVYRLRLKLQEGSLPIPRKPKKLLRKLMGKLAQATYWPRTDGEGLLERNLPMVRIKRMGKEFARPFFRAKGRVVGVDLEEGRLELAVRPNPDGKLKEPFTLTLWAPLALLEGVPLGVGVYAEGEVRLRTRRLVVKRLEVSPLWDDGLPPPGEPEPPTPPQS